MADPSETTQVSRESTPHDEELVRALRSLAAQVGSLQDDVQSLRAEARGLPHAETDRHGWEEGAPIARESAAWVRSVDSPRPRGLAVPWLLLEILFLVAVAVLAIVADLEPYAIGAVMLSAWILVALAEWLAARGERQRNLIFYGGAPASVPVPDDTAWFGRNGDDALLDGPSSERLPAHLPPPE